MLTILAMLDLTIRAAPPNSRHAMQAISRLCISPPYEDKIARRALRVQDLKCPERFAAKLHELLDLHNFVLTGYLNAPAIDFDTVYLEAMRHAELLKPMMADVSRELNDANRDGANLLFEGAQGTLLDVDHGSYPF